MLEQILEISSVSFAILFLVMLVLWFINTRINNGAIVDVGWGNGFVLVTIVACVLSDGFILRQLLIGGMVIFWGVRLAAHLFVDRVLTDKPEDGRYQDMRGRWKTNIHTKFFFFFEAQAVLITVLSLPFMIIAMNPDPQIAVLEWIGLGIFSLSLLGESMADHQLRRFKEDPASNGKTCRTGLWKYSRHPNYFFEWMIWVGFFVMALASPYGWVSIVSPLSMLYILLKVTGVPLTEAQALKSRGDDYREYQRTTSVFIPWWPKKAVDEAEAVA